MVEVLEKEFNFLDYLKRCGPGDGIGVRVETVGL